MTSFVPPQFLPVLLLICSNVFMTFAWYGHGINPAAELKTMQEVITLVVFGVFSIFWLGEAFTLKHVAGFALIAGGAALIFKA